MALVILAGALSLLVVMAVDGGMRWAQGIDDSIPRSVRECALDPAHLVGPRARHCGCMVCHMAATHRRDLVPRKEEAVGGDVGMGAGERDL